VVNKILFSWSLSNQNLVESNSELISISSKNRKILAYKNQLDFIKKRIKTLETDLDRSNQNAQELNRLMKSFNKLVPADYSASNLSHSNPAKSTQSGPQESKIAVLVFACNRPNAIEEHLTELIDKRSDKKDQFPIIVSQDCNHEPTAQTISKFSDNLFAHLKVFVYDLLISKDLI
jgi:alpha-1,3-mannosyl-glycoprotein beta-1,2-N-acetylglucosaminyltransferase